MTSWTPTEVFCVLCQLFCAAAFFWAQWCRGQAEARAEQEASRARYAEAQWATAQARVRELEEGTDEDDEPPPLFVHGETVDVDVTELTRVRGRLVGAVPDGDEVRFVVQLGHTTFLAHPDDCEKVEERTVGYRDAASKGLN